MKIETILLDMDGVVVHHFIELGRLFGIEVSRDNWPKGKTIIKEITGTPKEIFDPKVISAGAELWERMEPFPWFKTFVSELENIAPVYFLSAPEYGAGCVAGKVSWLEKYYGKGFDRFILTKHKTLFAKPTHLLIDDGPKNVSDFIAHGGKALLFDQPWNNSSASGDLGRNPDLDCIAKVREMTL